MNEVVSPVLIVLALVGLAVIMCFGCFRKSKPTYKNPRGPLGPPILDENTVSDEFDAIPSDTPVNGQKKD